MKEKLGYFITNNVSFNNTCVTDIIETFRLDLNAYDRRLWYMRHIINVIAEVFLFGNKSENFEAKVAVAKDIINLKKSMKL